MILLSLYLIIAFLFFGIMMFLEKSPDGEVNFLVAHHVPKETMFLLIALAWPIVLAGITVIRISRDKD